MRTIVALVFLISNHFATAAEMTYVEAQAHGRSDSQNDEYRQWYLEEMRPSFRRQFQLLMGSCLGSSPPSGPLGFGLVFTVNTTGRVERVIWKETSPFTFCLEAGLRTVTFPPAPKAEFYFGLEVQPSSPSASLELTNAA
jgi:hypothetical protein